MVRWRPFAFGLPVVTSIAVLLGALISNLRPGRAGLAMLAVWAAANGLWAMQTAVLTGMQRFDLIFRANALAAAIMIAGVLILPLGGNGVGVLFGLMATAYGAAAVVGITSSRRLVSGVVGSIEPESWRSIRHYAFNIWVTALLWSLVWSRGEMPIVRAYLGDAGVAHYAAAMSLFGGAIQGVMLAVSGIAPQLTVLWGSGRREEAIAAARTVMDVQLLFCGAGALFLICLAPQLISLAFGKAYHDAAAPLTVFAIGLLAMAVSSQNYILQLATDARFSRNITLLGLVLLFAAAILLTPLYGLVGTAIARASTMLLMAGAALVVITRSWGGAAITGRNVLIVATVVGASALSLAWKEASPISVRIILLAVALLVIGVSLRDARGRLLSAVVPGVLLRLVFASERNANAPSTMRSE
jgi:O-antigen/teichoic acid export membrane protein